MLKISFTCFTIIFTLLASIDAKNLNLSEKELRAIGAALNTAIKNHVDKEKWTASGKFNLVLNSDDFDVTADVDLSPNSILNGNDVLNGLANGNGNDNGNNNGNVVLQIFNVPVNEDHIIRPTPTDSTTNQETTVTWWSTTTESPDISTAPVSDSPTTPEIWWPTSADRSP